MKWKTIFGEVNLHGSPFQNKPLFLASKIQ
jgi:hypothetical protein